MRNTSLRRLVLCLYLILSVLESFETVQVPSVNPLEFSTSISTTRDAQRNKGSCILPEHPDFGQWSVLAGDQKLPSENVPFATILEINCNDGYSLSSYEKYVVCLGTKWYVPEIPRCLKKCSSLYTSNFTIVRCFDKTNDQMKCDEAINGTTANFECLPYSELSYRTHTKRYCLDGAWNLPEPVCQPVCGMKAVSEERLIINGKPIEKGNYPWVTAIYHKQFDGLYKFVCSGAMLTQKIVLTAATCISNISKENIVVAVGKYYSKYKDPRDSQAQYSKVDKVITPDKYEGDKQNFAYDIGVLITTKIFSLSKVAQPVCYEGILDFSITPKEIGVVSGWSYTTFNEQPSEGIEDIHVPYTTESECLEELPSNWTEKYYTFDKICGGLHNQSKVIFKGDVGGPLAFKHNGRYYIHGILSLVKNSSDLQVSTLYTNVSEHYPWLEKIIAENSM